MTDWKQVRGTQSEKPLEVDSSSSTSTVYLRRNIEEVEVEVSDSKVKMWQYEERELTREEYAVYQMIEESTKTITSFQKQEVIDEYTEELIAGGVI